MKEGKEKNAVKLRILQGRVAPEVKSRLYENTEVRYNNALFHIKRSTQLMKGLGSNLCRKISSLDLIISSNQ